MKDLTNGKVVQVALLMVVLALLAGSCEKSRPAGMGNSTVQPAPGDTADGETEGRLETRAKKVKVIAYYFHNTIRCESCLKIESLAKRAIEDGFASGVEWRVLNMEKDENKHFIDDYDLDSPSLVMSKIENGQEIKWKNLGKVWELMNDPEEFRLYVKNEVIKYLSGP